ncbi:MAG: nucleoside deaminase [Oscillospiraceae bacterium]|jgi:tRNA(adenine34) deaminase|nr:nucleoside deaminase [Oscillospiraceae bacterium]
MLTKDEVFMKCAISEAKKAGTLEEVPVGALIVQEGKVISKGHNLRETTQNALAHAELIVINSACSKLGSWRLLGCTLYVTLEPCSMCVGAAINARIDEIVFGCPSPLAHRLHHDNIKGHILERECSFLLSDFFAKRR